MLAAHALLAALEAQPIPKPPGLGEMMHKQKPFEHAVIARAVTDVIQALGGEPQHFAKLCMPGNHPSYPTLYLLALYLARDNSL